MNYRSISRILKPFPQEPVQWMPNSKNPWSPNKNAIVIISTILHSLDIILGWSPIMTSRPLTSNCKERLPRCQIVLFRHSCTLIRHISHNLLFGGYFSKCNLQDITIICFVFLFPTLCFTLEHIRFYGSEIL